MGSATGEIIAITGADGQVGRALLERLRNMGVRTTALTRQPVELPATRTVRDPLDGEAARAALKEADIIVHLAGTLRPSGRNSYETANVETTRAVVQAVREGKARRILYLSYVGADEDSANAYVRTKGGAERVLTESGREVVVFRCTHIIGPPDRPGPTADAMLAKPGKAVGVLGTGRQAVAPIYLGDVVSAIVSATQGGVPGTYDLAGPDTMTMNELVGLLNRNAAVPIRHVPGWMARMLGFLVPSLPRPMVQVLLADSVGDASRTCQTFGLTLMSLKRVWA